MSNTRAYIHAKVTERLLACGSFARIPMNEDPHEMGIACGAGSGALFHDIFIRCLKTCLPIYFNLSTAYQWSENQDSKRHPQCDLGSEQASDPGE